MYEEGHVYLIRIGENYKIGIARADCLSRRLRELNPEEVVAVSPRTPIYREFEKQLHRQYGAYRLPQSEWFAGFGQEEVSVIRACLGGGVCSPIDHPVTPPRVESVKSPPPVARVRSFSPTTPLDLTAINAGLKAKGVRLAVVQLRQGLFLRGTLPRPDGTKAQQRVSLGLTAVPANLAEAELRALQLHSALVNGAYPSAGLPWVAAAGVDSEIRERRRNEYGTHSIDSALALANAHLKSLHAGVHILRRSRYLHLQATLPDKNGSGQRRQQQVALRIPADTPGLKEAKGLALRLSAERQDGTFSWGEWKSRA